MVVESEYVDECPACGQRFIGMTPDEFREGHAKDGCPKSPFTACYVFPKRETTVPGTTGMDQ